MALPYSASQTNPMLSKGRMEKTLIKFGVSQINFGMDLAHHEIRVSFILNDIPISIPVSYMKLAVEFYKEKTGAICKSGFHEPLNAMQAKLVKIAINAGYAALEDYLKAMLTMHQLGIMTVEEIFLPNIDVQGIRMIDHLKAQAPQLMNGQQLFLKN